MILINLKTTDLQVHCLYSQKFFEKIMHDQISQYINSFLTPYQCGYRKGFSTQQALLSLIEKWRTRFKRLWWCSTYGSLKNF